MCVPIYVNDKYACIHMICRKTCLYKYSTIKCYLTEITEMDFKFCYF